MISYHCGPIPVVPGVPGQSCILPSVSPVSPARFDILDATAPMRLLRRQVRDVTGRVADNRGGNFWRLGPFPEEILQELVS